MLKEFFSVSGPPIKPHTKRPINQSGASKHPYKTSRFDNDTYLRENQISNPSPQVSHPELFSYEDLAQELLLEEEKRRKIMLDDVVKKDRWPVDKPKKAPKLISRIKKSDEKGQGNIPNEFKRRKKPSKLTMLNRIRNGIPLDSDDDEQDYVQVANKQKMGNEKRKKVLELIAQMRLSRERMEETKAIDNAVIMPDEPTVLSNSEHEILVSPQGGNDDVLESDVITVTSLDKNNKCNEKKSNEEQSSETSEDSDGKEEFDNRNLRKFEAFKLSDSLASHLEKRKSETKDLSLDDIKQIIETRKNTGNILKTKQTELTNVETIFTGIQALNLGQSNELVKHGKSLQVAWYW